MKQGEKSEFTIVKNYINSEDEDNFEDKTLNDLLANNFDNQKDLFVEIDLQQLAKVEDWYKDGSTLVKTIRKGGKGRSPYSDSEIKRK